MAKRGVLPAPHKASARLYFWARADVLSALERLRGGAGPEGPTHAA